MSNYQIALEKFQGPFHLLLELIENKKLDINEIALAHVTEQYLAYLEKVEERYPEELADFLVVATRLLLLKSKSLLPITEEDDQSEDLVKQLKMFEVYSAATKHLEERLRGPQIFSRMFTKIPTEKAFRAPENVTMEGLKEMFVGILKELEPIVRIPKALLRRVVSLKEKISSIQDVLNKKEKVGFHELLLEGSENRLDVIVTFLATLELVKQRDVRVQQTNNFGDIFLQKI